MQSGLWNERLRRLATREQVELVPAGRQNHQIKISIFFRSFQLDNRLDGCENPGITGPVVRSA